MNIAVLSDLHLGAGGAADRFGHTESDFLRFLDHLEGNFERIVLLGDIYELLTPAIPYGYRNELLRCRQARPRIAARFERSKYEYVVGNHDLAAGRLLGAKQSLLLNAGSTRLLFMHGHQNDGATKLKRYVQETGTWLGGWLLRLRLDPLFRLFDRVDMLLRGSGVQGGEVGDYEKWAAAAAMYRGADIVVTGHTHRGGVMNAGGRVIANSGTASEGNYEFLAIDTKTARFEHCAGF